MKKFLVGMLSVFLLMGASILAACGSSKVDLTLSRDSVSILYDYDTDLPSQEVVVATISGGKGVVVSASVNNSYENIISASATAVSSNRWEITITALNEGQGEVVVMTNQGNVSKTISVDVYSEVSHMSQNQNEDVQRKNFVLRGRSNQLIEENLLTFQPSSLSRRTITWSLPSGIEGAQIEGTNLIIDDSYEPDSITLTATTEKNISTNVVLPVVDPIEEELSLSWSYNLSSQFETIGEENNLFNIVPNEPTDEHYQGYIKLNYAGDLTITPVVLLSSGQPSDGKLIVNKYGEDEEGCPIFSVYVDREISNVNQNYSIYFKVGYENYDYAIDTSSNLINIRAREVVNDIEVRGENNQLIANKNTNASTQILYSEYLNSTGEMFNIEVLPTTIENYSNRYSISVAIGSIGEPIVENGVCPVVIQYYDQTNQIWQEIALSWDENAGVYLSREDANIDVKTLYLKAHSDLLQQNVNNVSITFTSIDNPNISTTARLELVKSVTAEEFVFENADFQVDSSERSTSLVIEKTFTLTGQTDIDGISVVVDSENVDIEGPIKLSNTSDSVTFKIILTLKVNSYGVTALDSYKFVHENGLESEDFAINIFLPLTEAGVVYDQGSNIFDSVTYSTNSNNIYFADGSTSTNISSLSNIMIKNGSTVPVLYRYNSSNNNYAVANVSVNYYDLDFEVEDDGTLSQEKRKAQVDAFKNLLNDPAGIAQIINGAYANENISKYSYFTADMQNIITSNVGFTYAVVTFSGAGSGENVDENGQTQIIRIILIESYIAPSNLSVTPTRDSEVSLYSSDSVSSNDPSLTRKNIKIDFRNSGVTYIDIANFEFVTTAKDAYGNKLMGNASISGNSVTWENGRYAIENIVINDYSISFDIVSASLQGQPRFSDTLQVHYKLEVLSSSGLITERDIMWTNISINISNAQRIESLTWEGEDEEGIYFEIGDSQPQFILLSTSPSNVQNGNISYIITKEDGTVDYTNTAIVSVGNYISQNRISLNLNGELTQGTTGYIYLLPEDAIYNGQISYYLKSEKIEAAQTLYTVSFESLGQIRSDSQTWYEYLIENAYFKSNSSVNGEAKDIDFSVILIRIKITVADGRSFAHAYRIYTAEEFTKINPSLYYRLMNSIEVQYTGTVKDLTGGIEGRAYDDKEGSCATVTFIEGSTTFIQKNSGTIRNINFNGNIKAKGFVADENTGTIENVTVDVNGTHASVLSFEGGIIGGITGTNSGKIINSSVLGLQIEGSGAKYIGGIAGANSGSIEGSRVEFYNLQTGTSADGSMTTNINTFSGATSIGGLVGTASGGSSITKSYVYNYVEDKQPFTSGYSFIADYTGAITLDESFAVRIISGNLCGGSDSITGEYYNATVSGDTYSVAYYKGKDDVTTLSDKYITKGQTGFLDYVNNGNAYFKNVYQSEKVGQISSEIQTTLDNNGYYKTIEVSSNEGIMFYYDIPSSLNSLSQSEINDLNALNTISLSQLINQENIEGLIVTSSNNNILKVLGSDIKVEGSGEVKLSLYSKQDVTNYKEYTIKVINALSNLVISWTDKAGHVYQVEDASISYLQKTTTRNYIVTYQKSSVVLGNQAKEYNLITSDMILENEVAYDKDSQEPEDSQNTVEIEINNNVVKVTANIDSIETDITINPRIFPQNSEKDSESSYQTAINNTFGRKFTISPTDGVIEFSVSEGGLSITPSTNAVMRVRVITTAEDDKNTILPQIRDNNGNILGGIATDPNKEYSQYSYVYYLAVDQSTPFMGAYVNLVEKVEDDKNTQYKTYTFEVTFEITQSYKSLISDDQSFVVSFISNSGNDSYYQDSDATFTLNLSKQKFTNIDVNNYLIESSQWTGNINSGYVTVHTAGEATSVLAPGGSSVFQVSVNPDYAYYDYMQLSYSGATVNNALQFELLSQYGTTSDNQNRRFTPNKEADINFIGQTLTYKPTQEEKSEAKGSLYFRIWVNTTVNADSTLKLTASFYKRDGTLLSRVDNYLTISYLTEAEITVNGEDIAYVARGATAKVQVRLPQDQSLDNFALDGNKSGINISSLTNEGTDPISGITTYTAEIFISVTAKTENDNSFAVTATVSRVLNGNIEIKTTSATIKIVDFMIDEENIEIVGAENNTLNIWLNVPKAFDIKYNFIPETYTGYSTSDEEAVKEVQKLLNARNDFLDKQTYANKESDFYINYKDSEEQTLGQRLFFVNGNEFVPVLQADGTNTSNAVRVTVDNGGNLSIIGLQMTDPIQMAVRTYILAGGESRVIDRYFTVNIQTYSDPDIPLTIEDANDFENLNPALYTSSDNVTANDYILTNDIILTDYTPFDTSLIRSLDGNGYTIHIKSFDVPNSNNINLSLFTTVGANTTLKNMRVNLYNGGQITINTAAFTGQATINIAGFAIENNGIITNCEVVAYRSEKLAYGNIENVAESSTSPHNNSAGINVTFVRGQNTTEEVYVGRESNWTPTISGFVITNSGSITNSRVGGESIIELGEELYSGVNPSGYTMANTVSLGTFYIIGQGNIAGFAYTNNGSISASSVGNLDVENRSGTSTYATSGFVHYNGTNASISGSFVEGVKSNIAQGSEPKAEDYTREGSSIKSRLGVIAGFIYNNEGHIQDSYSNILIANDIDEVRVYLASGFVYINNGVIEECYSASQIRNSMYNQMNFSGVNSEGELLANGTYKNCYYFNKELYQSQDNNDSTTETQYSTGAISVKDPADSSYYYGFALASGDSDGIWRLDSDGPTLIEANLIAYSHRYIFYIEEDSGYEGITGENEQGKYILLYSTLQIDNKSREINTSLGSESNPILIADASDFVEVMGASTSTNVAQYYNDYIIWGTYRVVNDIDLSSLTNATSLPSVNKAFAGRIYGNSFEIKGISITSDEKRVAFGLFSSLETRANYSPLITNLSMQINQVVGSNSVMTGGLAGYIMDAKLINIDISFSDNGGNEINGYNFAGALAGLAFGNNIIKNITVTDPTIATNQYSATSTSNYYTMANLYSNRNDLKNSLNFSTSISSALIVNNLSKYSYAGSVIGFVDNYSVESSNFSFSQATNYSINNVRISGTINIRAEIAGGAFGLTSYQTHINDVGIDIEGSTSNNSSKILSMKYFAGGAIGQAFGGLSRIYVQYNEATQTSIENNLSNLYGGSSSTSLERGALDIFSSSGTNYTQVYIGGLIGYVGSGKLDISYSRVNVISPTADYAGGIIGGMELDGATGYNASSELMPQETFTKYFINEVYATGDVRAKTVATPSQTNVNAGGIIGVIKGSAPRVALMSINAFNAIASYDYSTQAEITPAGNMSFSLQTNLILGSAFEYNDSGDLNAITLDINNYKSYLIFVQAQELSLGGSDAKSEIPSIGIYEGYYITNNSYSKLNLFGNVEGNSADTSESSLFKQNLLYAIASPYNYTSAAVGQTETRTAFIGSGAWLNENWSHPTSKLFPSIKYQKTSNVVYLDQYNVADVFNMMRGNSDITVIVRGLQSEGGTEYGNVNLDNYVKNYGTYSKIENFGGRLVGGYYNAKYIGIVSSKNFIDSVSPGFSVSNLTVTYRTTGNSTQIQLPDDTAGLFVAGDITEASISGLTLNVLSPVAISSNNNNIFGLVAPRIINTNISNFTINTSSSEAEFRNQAISSTDYILTINAPQQTTNSTTKSNQTEDTEIVKDYTVGLVSGELVQTSSASAMVVDGIAINTPAHFINIGAPTNKANVGTYFGKAYRNTDSSNEGNIAAVDLRINLKTIEKTATSSSNGNRYQEILINDPRGDSTKKEQIINIGGFIGEANNINYLGTFEGDSVSVETALVIGSSNNNLKVNAGLIIGNFESSTISQAIDFKGSTIKGGLYAKDKASFTELKAGAFAGSLKSSNITLSNISQINFEVVARAANGTLSNNILDINNFEDYTLDDNYIYPVTVAKADVGGIIGYSDSRFELTSNERLTINEMLYDGEIYIGGDSIQLNATEEANVGSVIGYADVPASGPNSSTSRLNINGALTSNANILVYGKASNVGGFIGKIVGGTNQSTSTDGSTTTTISSASIQGQSNGLLRYNGGVFSSITTINFGGAVGNLASNCNLTVNSTSFGGALKIFGADSNGSTVNAGGVIGRVGENSSDSQSITLTIEETYNYGDVFVQYDNSTFNELSEYYFGGIIGNVAFDADATNTYKISSNYTLMTSHNARYIETENTAHALFGNDTLQGAEESQISLNYYSYSVTLTEDKNGTDIGYISNTHSGYTGGNIELDREHIQQSMITIISDKLNDKDQINNSQSGHKLKPQTMSNDGKLDNDAYTFNGIKYYQFDQSVTNEGILAQLSNSTDGSGKDSSNLVNVAIIGDSTEKTYENKTKSFINTLSGYSFLSGFVLNVDLNDLNANENAESAMAGIANKMGDNTQIYAVQVKGTINVGGSEPITIGGLVAEMSSGKITNSSTALDITHRAANKIDNNFVSKDSNGVYGIANLLTSTSGDDTDPITNKVIDNTYSTGSVVSYIDINMYAFANGNSQAKISNCYSIAKLDWNDYTTADKMTSADSGFNIGVFGYGSTIDENSYFDYNAINDNNLKNDEAENDEADYRKTTSEIIGDLNENIYASSNYDFNYGYPTLNYSFMKLSSYAFATSFKTGKDKTENKDQTGNAISIFSGNTTSTKDNEEVYDNYVEEVTYQRLRNNTTPADSSEVYYFMVPNAGVLSQIASITTQIATTDTSSGTTTLTSQAVNNFVLLYDMDLAHTEFSSTWTSLWPDNEDTTDNEDTSDNGDTSAVKGFEGIIDGNGKTISALKQTLIANICSGVIKNLRLTDADITSAPILATTISGTTISNITLSGKINGGSSNLGALTNTLTGAKVYATTNTTAITLTASGETTIGGIAGQMAEGSIIKFSSNYGPISVTGGDRTSSVAVGGLVGKLSGGDIYYSYNATSVLNGYATSDALSTTPGNYYTGGLVGWANDTESTINNSYNSGIIKSGNKSNTLAAYAGGIVGKAYEGTANTIESIKECYNEGSVEALGQNAAFAFRWVDTNEDDVTDQLEMYQNSQKNVWAYGIGYYKENDNGEDNNTTVIENDNIYENGASAEYNTVFLTRPWLWIAAQATQGYTNVETNRAEVDLDYNPATDWIHDLGIPAWAAEVLDGLGKGVLFSGEEHNTLLYKLLLTLKVKIPAVTDNTDDNTDDNPDISINAYDSNGVPTSFAVIIEQDVNANYKANYGTYKNVWLGPGVMIALHAVFGVGWAVAWTLEGILALYNMAQWINYEIAKGNEFTGEETHVTTFEDVVTIRSSDKSTQYTSETGWNNPSHTYNNQHSIGKGDCNKENCVEDIVTPDEVESNEYVSETSKTIKSKTRSQNGAGRTDYDEIKIAGSNYYLANSNNIDNILQAGVYTGTITITSEELLYTGDPNDYEATVTVSTDNDAVISCTVQSVEKVKEESSTTTKTKITLRVFTDREEGLTGTLKINVKCIYEETLNFNAGDISYVYLDDKTLGINLGVDVNNLYAEEGVSIYLPNGKEAATTTDETKKYNVYKFCTSKDTENGEFIYLYYDTENKIFVYVPNTKIKNRLNSEYSVNNNLNFDSTITNWTIKTKSISNVTINNSSYNLTFSSETDGAHGYLVVSLITDSEDINTLAGEILELIDDSDSSKISYTDNDYYQTTDNNNNVTHIRYQVVDSSSESEFELKYNNTTIASYNPNIVKDYFIEKVSTLTSIFSNQTMLVQQVEGEPIQATVEFAGAGSSSSTHTAGAGTVSDTGSINYGTEFEGKWYGQGLSSSEVKYDSDVTLTITPTVEEDFTLSMGEQEIANYTYDKENGTGQWTITASSVNGCTIASAGGNLTIKYSLEDKTTDDIETDIADKKDSLSSTVENSFTVNGSYNRAIASATHTLKYTLDGSNLGADTIWVDDSNNRAIIGYKHSDSKWTIGDASSIEISGTNYNISISGNELTFSITNTSASYEFTNVSDFMGSLEAYQDDFMKTISIDTNIKKGAQKGIELAGTNMIIDFENKVDDFEAYKLSSEDSEAYNLSSIDISDTTYKYQVSFGSSHPTDLSYYSIGDIKVYKGTYDFNYSYLSYTKYTGVTIAYTDILKGELKITFKDKAGNDKDLSITLNAQADGDMSILYTLGSTNDRTVEATGEVTFALTTNSVYRFTNKDVKVNGTDIGIILKNNDIKAFIDGSLAVSEGETGVSINDINIDNILFKNNSSISDDYYFQILKSESIAYEEEETQETDEANEDTEETKPYTITTTYSLVYYYSYKQENDDGSEITTTRAISLGSYSVAKSYNSDGTLKENGTTKSYSLTEDFANNKYFTLTEFTTKEGDAADILYGYYSVENDTYHLQNGGLITLKPGKIEIPEDGQGNATVTTENVSSDEANVLVYQANGKNYIYSDGLITDSLANITGILGETGATKEADGYKNFDSLIEDFFNAKDNSSYEPVIKIEDNMIVIADDYNVVDGNYEEEGLLSEYKTFVMQNNYKWKDAYFPNYQSITQTLKIDGSQFDKVKLTELDYDLFDIINDGDDKKVQIVMLLADKAMFNAADQNISVSVNVKTEPEGYSIVGGNVTNNNKDTANTEINGNVILATNGKPLTAQPIIFTQDVSLQGIAPVIWNVDINIIGNGYYLSSYNTLFSEVGATKTANPFIKDLMILNETYNQSYFTVEDTSSNEPVINNVKLYGSVLNYQKDTPALISADATLNDIENYTTINSRISNSSESEGSESESEKALTLFTSGIGYSTKIVEDGKDKTVYHNTGINYGFIVAINGKDGGNGKNGDVNNKAGREGDPGYKGGSIQAYSDSNFKMNNQGILKVGDGGNGGAGGSTYYVRGTDGIRYNYKLEEVAVGAASSGGSKGDIVGFDSDAKAVGLKGLQGNAGFLGRNPISDIQLQNIKQRADTNDSSITFITLNRTTTTGEALTGNALKMEDLPGYGGTGDEIGENVKSWINAAYSNTFNYETIPNSNKQQ